MVFALMACTSNKGKNHPTIQPSNHLPVFSYLLKRLLLFIPTLAVASMLAFALSRIAPGDQVEEYLMEDPFGDISTPNDLRRAEKRYISTAHDLNLDQPTFYFSVTSAAYPDTLYKIAIKRRKELLQNLIAQYGNWPSIEAYYQAVRSTDLAILALPDSLSGMATEFKINLRELYVHYLDGTVQGRLDNMENALFENAPLSTALSPVFIDLKNKYNNVKNGATPHLLKIPSFQWHGLDNQYHRWAIGFFQRRFWKIHHPKKSRIGNHWPCACLDFGFKYKCYSFGIYHSHPIGYLVGSKAGGAF